MKERELMITLGPSSWCYYLTNATTAKEAVSEFYGTLEAAGINTDNMRFETAELRDRDEFGVLTVDIDEIKFAKYMWG